MEHLALTIFSVCVQASIGIMLFAAIGKRLSKDGVFKAAVVTAGGLAVVGLAASLLHLGQPLHAANALMKFGTSWLSREIWLTGAFVGVTLLAALLILIKPLAKSAIDALIAVAALIGLVDVAAMAAIYNFTSVPAWQSSAIYVEFYAAAISMGALIFLALSIKEAANMKKTVSIAVAGAVIVQVAAMMIYYINLGARDSLAVQQSLAILSSMGFAMIVKWVFILAGAGLLLFPVKEKGTVSAGVLGAAALMFIGQMVGRYLFYAIMIITQVGLN